jgi:5'-nucleotidase
MKTQHLLLILLTVLAGTAFAQNKHLTILHTNDVHSNVEPNNKNLGGMVRAATYINEVRAAEKNVLLLSAGDFFQGTPYFNLFYGIVEIELMNAMRYDAACLGNHEFDNGIDSLAKYLGMARFDIVTANYDMSSTPLRHLVKPYIIIEKEGLKIGITGVGTPLDDNSRPGNWAGMRINNPVETANHMAAILKEEEHCDLVICLTHIGYDADIVLAENSRNIDVIIGGHSHTVLKEADVRKNLDGKDVPITQTGKDGLYVGRIDISIAQ